MTHSGGRKPRIVGNHKEYRWHFRPGTTLHVNGVVVTSPARGGFDVVVLEPLSASALAGTAAVCENTGDTNSAGQTPRE